jgi:hypothetical protein
LKREKEDDFLGFTLRGSGPAFVLQVHPKVSFFRHLSTFYPSVCLSVCLSICLSACLSVFLSISLFFCLSVNLSFCPSVLLSVCMSLYLSRRGDCCCCCCMTVFACLSSFHFVLCFLYISVFCLFNLFYLYVPASLSNCFPEGKKNAFCVFYLWVYEHNIAAYPDFYFILFYCLVFFCLPRPNIYI